MILTGTMTKVAVDYGARIAYAQVKVNPTDAQFYQVIFAMNPGEVHDNLLGLQVQFIPNAATGEIHLVSRQKGS